MKRKNISISSLQAPILVNTLLQNLRAQKKFIQQNIIPVLGEARKNNDGSIEENDLKKITGYYGLAVPAILGEAFCVLKGRKMTGKERLTSTCQGAMTGLFDDFFDKQRLSDEGLKEFLLNPGTVTGNSTAEKLFLYFYATALANAPQPNLMQEKLYRVYQAQVLSKEQARPGLVYEQIKDITLLKGAESLIFYRTAFENPPDIKEEKMLFCLGGLMQLSNDIFDVYKDQQQGIHTLVTTAKKIKDLRLLFSSLLEIGYAAAYKTAYTRKNIKSFLSIISLGIFSRCFVCLDQLEKLEARSGNVFEPARYKRNDLVCDMDKTANKLRSLGYHLRTSR
ncbi:MAG TPA: hypothetical protein VK489_01335 [Ferruginibacter sp.]|nr:hypothetical protein [Ferruginibacter sp.]